METIAAILSRRSTPKLTEPVPNDDELQLVMQCALRAPDHGRLRPWRFFAVTGDDRIKFGELYLRAAEQDNPELDESKREKLLNMPMRAPMLIIAIAEVTEDHKVPSIEQVVSVGAAVQNIQLALHDMGYGCMWRTGEMAENNYIKTAMGFSAKDEIVGFLYIGTPEQAPKEVPAPEPGDFLTRWPSR
ncbi:MAG: nitroreductase [Pseudomonadales bacterium]|nr:nitroreductase [Pseudomonadales bacterium]